MSLIFVSNWQELLSEMYMLIVPDPAPFNYSDGNNALIKCWRSASPPRCAILIPLCNAAYKNNNPVILLKLNSG